MHIGRIIPPVDDSLAASSRKAALEAAANMIMARIVELIPEEDKRRWNRIRDERFELKLAARTPDDVEVPLPPELQLARPEMLAKFFHRPLMLDVFARNLKLPVTALQQLDSQHDPQYLAAALDVALHYLNHQNPQFLSYRFGYEEAGAMKAGLEGLREIAGWAQARGYRLYVTPIRRYRRRGSAEEIVEDRPGGVPAL
jgi:hypothetical protein